MPSTPVAKATPRRPAADRSAAASPSPSSDRRSRRRVDGPTDHIRPGPPADGGHHCGLGTLNTADTWTSAPRVRRPVPGSTDRQGELGAEAMCHPSPRSGASPRASRKRAAPTQPLRCGSFRVLGSDKGGGDLAPVLPPAEDHVPVPPYQTHHVPSPALPPAARPRIGAGVATMTRRQGSTVGLTLDEQLRVTHVTAGSAAASAGVRVGTVLTAVNGEPVGSQEAAVSAFRSAGDNLSAQFEPSTRRPSLPIEHMPVAGVASDRSRRSPPRRNPGVHSPPRRRAMTPPPPQRTTTRPAGGLGPPGLGPMRTPWGNAEFHHGVGSGGGGAEPMQSPFKPNTWVPPQHFSPGRRRAANQLGNKTSYEVALEKGHCADDGHWDHMPTTSRSRSVARERYHRVHTEDPNFLSHVATPHASPSVRRGLNRDAVPGRMREAATGGLPQGGAERGRPRGLRVPPQSGLNADLLSHDATVTDLTSTRRGTPNRARSSHQSHGDILAHGPSCQANLSVPLASPRTGAGKMTRIDAFEAPERPTMPVSSRVSRFPRDDTDVFHQRPHRSGRSLDMPGGPRSGKSRSLTPAARQHQYSDLSGPF
eukprot:TRINITY_DN28434_c0_g1_i1.p1 TRINITY_DN28434_c0_g1~~TRINITY_DN28434_c0_g1_i1.p1  ORF type:complete len:593 (+),score=134.10 TRINITY_DN28434_c0_g1_i1:123-1901(+)